ncbi:lysosomal cobalamin transporter ABCD4-like [Sycon ciliatum]|uniref:lysosomal cobalamin transporter ABCD4-like n=1 Tax=Sycon ciliatum TaxID=27933 RepID=UPI0031F661A5
MIPDISQSSSSAELPQLDWRFVKQVWRVTKIAFVSHKQQATLLALAMLVTAIGEKFLEYYVGLIPSQFYSVLPMRNKHAFLHLLAKALGFIIGVALTKSLATFFSQLVYVTWRRDLVEYIQNLYTSDNAFFHLNCVRRSVDNPDQRITQDVDRFCNQFSQQLLQLILAPFTIVFYSYKTWTQVGWFAPVFVYIMFLVGVVINRLLVSFIVPIVVEQEKLEGDFRYHHVQLRTRAEAVAFCGAGELEGRKLLSTYLKLYATQKKIVYRKLLLLFSINLFDYVGAILSYVIIAIPILAGAYPESQLASIISKASFQTIYLIFQFTQLLDISRNFTNIAAYVHRINGLLDALQPKGAAEKRDSARRRDSGSHGDGYSAGRGGVGAFLRRASRALCGRLGCCRGHDDVALLSVNSNVCDVVANPDVGDYDDNVPAAWTPPPGDPKPFFHLSAVSYKPPGSRSLSSLVSDLNLSIFANSGIMITGSTGSGKSSLLRVLRGLWPTTAGNVWQWKGGGSVVFLPQEPFLTTGSLLQQVVYPERVSAEHLVRSMQCPVSASVGSDNDNGESGRRMMSSPSATSDLPLLHDATSIDSDAMSGEGDLLEETVSSCLEQVGLSYLVGRAGGSVTTEFGWSWYAALSPGEAQRIAFARLLYQRPALAFLDEASSALDDESSCELMKRCRARGITLVAVVHHLTGREKEFFSHELRLEGKGDWTLTAI